MSLRQKVRDLFSGTRRKAGANLVNQVRGNKQAVRGPFGKTPGVQAHQRIAEQELRAQERASQRKRK